jgi:hypothetical protein
MEITAPYSTLPSGHRMRRQHPSVPYNVRVTVVHGAYPFTYALTANVPSGMGIDSSTGVITWATPVAGTYSNIEVTVTDAEEAVATETWTLTVGTSGHKFIDIVAGNDTTGDGSFATPWASLDKAYDSAAAGDILWIKGPGTYLLTGLPQDGGESNPLEWKVHWDVGDRSTIFIGYGSSKPIIDFEHNQSYCDAGSLPTCPSLTRETARFHMVGDTTWIDNIEVHNSFIMAFQMEADAALLGWTVRRVDFDGAGPGYNGSNGAMVMSQSMGAGTTPRYGSYFGENTATNFHGVTGQPEQNVDAVKLYTEEYALIADNVVPSGSNTIFFTDGVIAVKGGVLDHIEIRANDLTMVGCALGGNMTTATDFECRFNLFRVSGTDPNTGEPPLALHTGQGPGSPVRNNYYRNTFVGGRVRIRDDTTAVGPYTFTRNVIVNEDGAQLIPHFCDGHPSTSGWADCFGLSDTNTIEDVDNLKGNAAAGIVDANGELQGSYLTDHGPTTAAPRGHMLA